MSHSGENHAENGGNVTGTTARKNDLDEQALLASMDAYLLEQNVYEKDVLRQASYRTVPQLLLLSDDVNRNNDEAHDDDDDDDHFYSAALPREQLPGFPSSMTSELLQPFQHHSHSQKQPHSSAKKSSKRENHMMDTALASHVLRSILDQVQQHEPPPPPPPSSHVVDRDKFNALDLHHMKEQILLHLLETIGSTYRNHRIVIPMMDDRHRHLQQQQQQHNHQHRNQKCHIVPSHRLRQWNEDVPVLVVFQ